MKRTLCTLLEMLMIMDDPFVAMVKVSVTMATGFQFLYFCELLY